MNGMCDCTQGMGAMMWGRGFTLPNTHKSLLRAHREGQAKARGAANGRALGKHRNTGLALAVGSLGASRRWARRGVALS